MVAMKEWKTVEKKADHLVEKMVGEKALQKVVKTDDWKAVMMAATKDAYLVGKMESQKVEKMVEQKVGR